MRWDRGFRRHTSKDTLKKVSSPPNVSTYAPNTAVQYVQYVTTVCDTLYAIRACALYEYVTHANTSLYSVQYTVAHQITNPPHTTHSWQYVQYCKLNITHTALQSMYGWIDGPTHLLSVSTYLRAFWWHYTCKRFGAEEAHWAHNPRVGGSKLPIARATLCFFLDNTGKGSFANYYFHKRINYRFI